MGKILVLGGSFQHIKVVEAAHKLNHEVFVTDYLLDSPAKRYADKALNYSVDDIDSIVSFCNKEHINGVINTSLDPCQRPYVEICTKLNLPCYGSKDQFEILTNKSTFKACCHKYGVDTIKTYGIDNISDKEYPVLVKPVDSRGSRGLSVCWNRNELLEGIDKGKIESKSGMVIIEKYYENARDFTIAYMFTNGKAHLVRTGDRYTGSKESGLTNLAIKVSSPSEYADLFIEKANKKIIDMLKGIGIKNGPVFFQGIIDGDRFRLYDPGFRFAGGEYEVLFQKATGIDLISMLVKYSLSGNMDELTEDDYSRLNGMRVLHLDPTLEHGKIGRIEGIDKVQNMQFVETVNIIHKEGDVIEQTNDLKRRLGEICILTPDEKTEKTVVDNIISAIKVISVDGENMLSNLGGAKQL